MKLRGYAVLFGMLLGAAVTSGCVQYTPEGQIRRVLAGIADRLSHDAPLNGLAAAAAAAALQEYLSPNVEIDAGSVSGPLTGRDAVIAAAARLAGSTPTLRVQFVDVQVVFGTAPGTHERAEVTCNVTAEAEDRAGQRSRDARELNLIMRAAEGRWVVERVKALNVVEPVS